jgi:hypothetical protein
MKFLIPTFDHNYYLWQCLVQINNFMKYGYDIDAYYMISTHNPSPVLQSIMNHPKIKSKFFITKDERTNMTYPVTLRHYILEKFYRENPDFEKHTVFLIDPDAIFTNKIDFTEMEKDEYWHLSNTISYIGSQYIKNKSVELFEKMCEVVGVSPEVISNNEENSGGAQYIMKNINADFFKKSLDDSEKLYRLMKETDKIYSPQSPIQSWTADMWSLLWNAIYFNHKIKINKELDFCWATDNISRWNETNIFHNAGIPGDSATHFSKITYQVSPFNKELYANNDNCTYNYIKEIKETEETFKDILF